MNSSFYWLTHWGRVTHISISNLTIIGSDNGLSPGRCQAITWTNTDLLSIGPLWTNVSEIQIEIQNFSFMKMYLKMLSRPFCPRGNELWNGVFFRDLGTKMRICPHEGTLHKKSTNKKVCVGPCFFDVLLAIHMTIHLRVWWHHTTPMTGLTATHQPLDEMTDIMQI